MKKHLDKILIILGVIIIAASLIMKYQTKYKEDKLLEEYKERMISLNDDEDTDDNSDYSDERSNDESKADDISKDIDKSNENEHENIIGIIEIPKIDLVAPIGQGTDKETLRYSVGHFEQTEMPGEKGNCCIIGHRSYTYGEFFNRLDEIEKGDKITVNYNNKIYTYIVREIFVVEPEEVSVLEDDNNIESELTLITCTPLRVGTHRLIIKGQLEI